MEILHLKSVFNDYDEVIRISEAAGFKPAPCITKLEDVKHNDFKDFHKPDKNFFNADKVFLRDGTPEYEEIEPICLKLIDKILKLYMEQQDVPEWEGYEIHYFSTVRYKESGFFRLHQDTIWQPDDLMKSFSIVAYLSDFEGGELSFPQHKLTLFPKKGDVVIFPSGGKYKHTAGVVTKGSKYVLTLWPLVRKQIELTK